MLLGILFSSKLLRIAVVKLPRSELPRFHLIEILMLERAESGGGVTPCLGLTPPTCGPPPPGTRQLFHPDSVRDQAQRPLTIRFLIGGGAGIGSEPSLAPLVG